MVLVWSGAWHRTKPACRIWHDLENPRHGSGQGLRGSSPHVPSIQESGAAVTCGLTSELQLGGPSEKQRARKRK